MKASKDTVSTSAQSFWSGRLASFAATIALLCGLAYNVSTPVMVTILACILTAAALLSVMYVIGRYALRIPAQENFLAILGDVILPVLITGLVLSVPAGIWFIAVFQPTFAPSFTPTIDLTGLGATFIIVPAAAVSWLFTRNLMFSTIPYIERTSRVWSFGIALTLIVTAMTVLVCSSK